MFHPVRPSAHPDGRMNILKKGKNTTWTLYRESCKIKCTRDTHIPNFGVKN